MRVQEGSSLIYSQKTSWHLHVGRTAANYSWNCSCRRHHGCPRTLPCTLHPNPSSTVITACSRARRLPDARMMARDTVLSRSSVRRRPSSPRCRQGVRQISISRLLDRLHLETDSNYRQVIGTVQKVATVHLFRISPFASGARKSSGLLCRQKSHHDAPSFFVEWPSGRSGQCRFACMQRKSFEEG